MGLIKASNAPATLTPFSMADIENQAMSMLLRAREDADQILAAAREEAESIKQSDKALSFAEGRAEGVEKGLEEGRTAGLNQALDEHRSALTQLVTSLNSALELVEQSRSRLEDEGLSEVIKLAIAIAERVAKRQGVLDSGVLTENVRAAMKMVVHSTDLRVALHPAQKQTFISALPKLKLEWPAFEHVEVVEETSLSPGGCRIFTRDGLVDADLEEQLRRIAAELLPGSGEGEAPAEPGSPLDPGSAGASPSPIGGAS